MKRFFDLTFKPFFVVTGIGTALGAVNAFWPQWGAEKVLLVPFDQDYTIILQHWGCLLGVMGVFMIVVAFWEKWRDPILIFSACEKAFFVYLVARNISRPYARGLWFGGGMDAMVVLYTIAYFAVRSLGTSTDPG